MMCLLSRAAIAEPSRPVAPVKSIFMPMVLTGKSLC
jgi:hypothetical protein